jgi:solute carrier family 13 (sodium-dependent dicarboxylate transporter), member 2/3/5
MTNKVKLVGLFGGPILFLFLMMAEGASLSTDAAKVIAIAAWMLTWWITEAVPMAVAALLPLVLFPLTGVLTIDQTSAPYGSKYVHLFLGGFLVALAMEKWNLHKRIALNIVLATGSSANRIVLGFMIATAFLSMWISNTATTLMMLPIAGSVIALFKDKIADEKKKKSFAVVLLLGIAYAANCGGMATLVGTPPNAAMAGILSESFGVTVGFGEWMALAFPFTVILLTAVFLVLTKVMYKLGKEQIEGGHELILAEREKLGKMSDGERAVLWVFASTATLWMLKDVIMHFQNIVDLNDTSIAIAAGIALFIIPGGKEKKSLLDWDDTKNYRGASCSYLVVDWYWLMASNQVDSFQ